MYLVDYSILLVFSMWHSQIVDYLNPRKVADDSFTNHLTNSLSKIPWTTRMSVMGWSHWSVMASNAHLQGSYSIRVLYDACV